MVAGSTSDDGLVASYRINVTPKWSSDDHRVVYGRTIDPAAPAGRGGIYVADLGQPGDATVRSDTRVPVPGTASPFYPAFSPVEGSDQIAYGQTTATKGCTRNDIFVTSSAGGSARQVTTTKTTTICQILQPEWSPDGAWIAFVGAAGMGTNALYRIAADGRSKAVLVAASRTASYYTPRWRR
jgi:Tol biopolymer transport system component